MPYDFHTANKSKPSGNLLSVDLLYSLFNNKKKERITMKLIQIFAENVRKYRLEKNLSQEKLAEMTGLHRTYISGADEGT